MRRWSLAWPDEQLSVLPWAAGPVLGEEGPAYVVAKVRFTTAGPQGSTNSARTSRIFHPSRMLAVIPTIFRVLAHLRPYRYCARQHMHRQRVDDACRRDDIEVCRDELGGGSLALLRIRTGLAPGVTITSTLRARRDRRPRRTRATVLPSRADARSAARGWALDAIENLPLDRRRHQGRLSSHARVAARVGRRGARRLRGTVEAAHPVERGCRP